MKREGGQNIFWGGQDYFFRRGPSFENQNIYKNAKYHWNKKKKKKKLCHRKPILAIRPLTRGLNDLQERVFWIITDIQTHRQKNMSILIIYHVINQNQINYIFTYIIFIFIWTIFFFFFICLQQSFDFFYHQSLYYLKILIVLKKIDDIIVYNWC